ncbi:MAG TPA: cyclase family protein [Cyclobacteriaceae bacterium]|nr:cyclase family protein [Cyclobacteriaceae bacterium]HRJ80328.1 cyclase family protein [Cyclobacteriaceae bacterium]
MIVTISFNGKTLFANLHEPLDISLPIREGEHNPNCYWAEPVKFETIKAGNFIGSVKDGGSVNYQKLTITPHGNGTHTECYGHIADDGATVNQNLNHFHFLAELVSAEPKENSSGDLIITRAMLAASPGIEAMVIRTLPNKGSKKTKQYSGTNPPYVEAGAVRYLVERGVQHILIDLPSLDKEDDEGKLLAHKAFWKFPQETRKHATVTELIYVPDDIPDGLYLLNLQIIGLEMDASPSKPVLYKLKEVL